MAFNPPLGSTSPAVLLDNAKRLDELANGPAAIVPDRAGQPLDSWRQIMAKTDNLIAQVFQKWPHEAILLIGAAFFARLDNQWRSVIDR